MWLIALNNDLVSLHATKSHLYSTKQRFPKVERFKLSLWKGRQRVKVTRGHELLRWRSQEVMRFWGYLQGSVSPGTHWSVWFGGAVGFLEPPLSPQWSQSRRHPHPELPVYTETGIQTLPNYESLNQLQVLPKVFFFWIRQSSYYKSDYVELCC